MLGIWSSLIPSEANFVKIGTFLVLMRGSAAACFHRCLFRILERQTVAYHLVLLYFLHFWRLAMPLINQMQ